MDELSPAARAYLERLRRETPEQLAAEHPEPEVLEYWDEDEDLNERTDSWLAVYDEYTQAEPGTPGPVAAFFRKLQYRGAHRADG